MAFLDVLNDIPADPQVPGHILDGGKPAQFKDVAFKGPREALSRIGETDLDLPHQPAGQAPDARHGKFDPYALAADGNRAKPAQLAAPADHPSVPASRTAQAMAFLADRENHGAFFITGVHVTVATDTESMIKKACGHDGSPFW